VTLTRGPRVAVRGTAGSAVRERRERWRGLASATEPRVGPRRGKRGVARLGREGKKGGRRRV
jgi:hypothetical protein